MIIICYDFSDDHKRYRFSKFLKKYGNKIQYSVYTIKNSKRILDIVVTEIEEKYKKDFDNTDNIYIFRVCERCQKSIIRYGSAGHDTEDVVYLGQ